MPTASPIEYCRPLLERPGRQTPSCSCAGCGKSAPTKSEFAWSRSVSVEKIFTSHTVWPAASRPAQQKSVCGLTGARKSSRTPDLRYCRDFDTPVSASVAAGSATAAFRFRSRGSPRTLNPEPRSQISHPRSHICIGESAPKALTLKFGSCGENVAALHESVSLPRDTGSQKQKTTSWVALSFVGRVVVVDPPDPALQCTASTLPSGSSACSLADLSLCIVNTSCSSLFLGAELTQARPAVRCSAECPVSAPAG
jgi:hypothetical protein